MSRVKVSLVFVLCAIYSLIAALYPFEFSGRTLHLSRNLPWELLSYLVVRVREVDLGDFLKNILYFLPWGVLVYEFRAPRLRKSSSVLWAALVGGVVSFSIEVCQIFFTKHPSIFDVLANAIGAGIGALSCIFSPIEFRRAVARSLALAGQSQILLVASLCLGTVPLLISLTKWPGSGLGVWDRHYTNQLGNGPSLETPWLGTVYQAAVYDRALALEEIAQGYQLSTANQALGHRGNRDMLVLCSFGEQHGDRASDDSHCGLPPNLALLPTSSYRWLHGGNGVETLQPTVLKGGPPAKELFDAIRGRSELSLEVLMTWADIDQNRAASAVSLSQNSAARNFLVDRGDLDSDFHARSRFLSGRAVDLRAPKGFLTSEQIHLVVTYKGGVRKLFVNGREYAHKNFDLRLADFIVSFGNNPAAQIAYSFVYFFSMSYLLSRWLSKRSLTYSVTVIVSVLIAVSFLSMTEALQAYLFARSVDLVFVSYGIVVVVAGALCGIFLAGNGGGWTTLSFCSREVKSRTYRSLSGSDLGQARHTRT